MTRLLLVRHAPTPETGTRLTGRAGNVSLGPKGEAHARATAARLASTRIKAVYTSPITRTSETAGIIAEAHGLTPILREGLTEIDFGAWTGRTLKSLRRITLWGQVQRVPSRVRFPDGESFIEAQLRAVDAVERIAADVGKATAIVVSHSDVIKLILAHYLGQPLDLFQRLHISTTSVSELILPKGGSPMVGAVNDRGRSDW
ncbi:MAG: histidine phosphatase family protein [Acidimicrobiia bacterium]|nr:histidine phosphatase family protein [Acidimicrobiia bacterium]